MGQLRFALLSQKFVMLLFRLLIKDLPEVIVREIRGVPKQQKLVQKVLDEKEVSILIEDIESLQISDTKYKSVEKFEHDKKLILETPWLVSVVLQNKNSKISEIIDLNLKSSGIDDVSSKRIFSALRAVYKSSNKLDDNERAEKI